MCFQDGRATDEDLKTKSLSLDDIKSLPKADLHVHLNGAIPTDLVKQFLLPIRHELPTDYSLDEDLRVLTPVGSLREYFKPWIGLKQLPRGYACLQAMVDGAVLALAQDKVSYVEFRNSPFNISSLNNISLHKAIGWLSEAAESSESKANIKVRYIISLSRYKLDLNVAEALLDAIRIGNKDQYIVGFDLSGNEDEPVPDKLAYLFRKAKDELGLGITIHAGETGSLENIEWAIEACRADRIGHALAAAKSHRLLQLLSDRDICVETCLKSNILTGYASNMENHPIHEFIRFNVPFVLCSDNPAINASSLSEDYALFLETTGQINLIEQMLHRQNHYAFTKGHLNGNHH